MHGRGAKCRYTMARHKRLTENFVIRMRPEEVAVLQFWAKRERTSMCDIVRMLIRTMSHIEAEAGLLGEVEKQRLEQERIAFSLQAEEQWKAEQERGQAPSGKRRGRPPGSRNRKTLVSPKPEKGQVQVLENTQETYYGDNKIAGVGTGTVPADASTLSDTTIRDTTCKTTLPDMSFGVAPVHTPAHTIALAPKPAQSHVQSWRVRKAGA